SSAVRRRHELAFTHPLSGRHSAFRSVRRLLPPAPEPSLADRLCRVSVVPGRTPAPIAARLHRSLGHHTLLDLFTTLRAQSGVEPRHYPDQQQQSLLIYTLLHFVTRLL